MPDTIRRIRIFISSPGDVNVERELLFQAISRLNLNPHYSDRIAFTPYLYEGMAPALVGPDPQDVVDTFTGHPESMDIVVCLFWHRMGTPYTSSDGRQYNSGTEYELRSAYEAYQRVGKPHILLYRCNRPPESDPQYNAAQAVLVSHLFDDFANKDLKGLYFAFATPQELERQFITDIDRIMVKFYQDAMAALESGAPPRFVPQDRAIRFVGREKEITEIGERLRQGESVLVTGMGGIGKSALATETLQTLAADPEAFPGGIHAIRCTKLSGLDGVRAILDKVMVAWSVPLSREEQARATDAESAVDIRETALQLHFQQRGPALLFLDNVERALPVARLVKILSSIGVTALLTSRYASAPSLLFHYALDVLTPEDAVQLFRQRFESRGGQWNEAGDQPAAHKIVTTIGYLPLAIELAAARAGLRKIQATQLAQDYEQPGVLDTLKYPGDDNASVRFELEQSLAELTPDQRIRYSALSILDGTDWPRHAVVEQLLGIIPFKGFTAEAMEQMQELMGEFMQTLATGMQNPIEEGTPSLATDSPEDDAPPISTSEVASPPSPEETQAAIQALTQALMQAMQPLAASETSTEFPLQVSMEDEDALAALRESTYSQLSKSAGLDDELGETFGTLMAESQVAFQEELLETSLSVVT